MPGELPLLIAALKSDQVQQLQQAALVGAEVRLPLKWTPVESGPHLLEVYLPTTSEPLNFLAEPLEIGDGSEAADVPLRVYPWEGTAGSSAASAREVVEVVPHLEVAGVEAHVEEAPADRFIGRSFARGRFEILAPL